MPPTELSILFRLTAPGSESVDPNNLRLRSAIDEDVLDWFNLLSKVDQASFLHRLSFQAQANDRPFAGFLPAETVIRDGEFCYQIVDGKRMTTIGAHDVVDVQLPGGAIRLDQVVYGIEAVELGNNKIAHRLGLSLPFLDGTKYAVALDTVKINPSTIRFSGDGP